MSNLKKFFAALVIAVTGISCAQASEFAGPYAGFKVGENWSDAFGVVNTASRSTTFPGLTAGYGFDVKQFMIGAEVFADFHHGSTTFYERHFVKPFGELASRLRSNSHTSPPVTTQHCLTCNQ
jgi:outer membrane immunogenic protein